MRAYYGSRFSTNMTTTPEGFLICHNVPVSRTGWYEYLGEEIGVNDMAGKVVQVYRSPEEVFSPGAMASFEGKILADEHPPELVTPDNATIYTKGVVQNVRPGTGAESDLLIADLVVYDKALIEEIQEGKREVSCGYDCVYEPFDSDGPDPDQQTYQQQQICGNHVAVVKSGRAGDRVAIKDSKTKTELDGEKRMSKKVALPKKKQSRMTDFLAAVGLKQFALDAEPDEIQEAVDAMAEERTAADEDVPPQLAKEQPAPSNDADPAIQALEAKVDKLTELIAQLAKSEAKETSPEAAIDDAITELQQGGANDGEEEESHTIPVEQMMDEDGPVTDPEDRPQPALTGDNAYKIAALKAIKPILAKISDPTERKAVADAAIASIKAKPKTNTYAALTKPKKTVADQAAPAAAKDQSQIGKDIAKKFNPHYKDRA